MSIALFSGLAALALSLAFRVFAATRRTSGPATHALGIPAVALSALAAAAFVLFLAWQGAERGLGAFASMRNVLVFFGALLAGLAAFAKRLVRGDRGGVAGLGFGAAALAVVALAASPLFPAQASGLLPILRSGWLAVHVLLAAAGEACFIAGAASSLVLLLSRNASTRASCATFAGRVILVGWTLYGLGALVFGALWAYRAWGSWWSWDPKETWALVTWLAYSFVLHVKFVRRVSPTPSACASLGAFLVSIFALVGPNYLIPGLHSYV